ncbi:MAG: hypothetical protein KGR26_10180, partial [Cyanobacteria bacterium REEB65]|nr:hypothetical protein [Cyanobacteria bacterium REEB65]
MARRVLLWVLLWGAALGCSRPALARDNGHADIRAEFGPAAPIDIVESLQSRVASDTEQIYQALPPDFKGRDFSIAVADTPRGVDLGLQIDGSPSEVKRVANAIAMPLQDVAQEVGGDYAVAVTVHTTGLQLPELPPIAMPKIGTPRLPPGTWQIFAWSALAGSGLAILALVMRRARRPRQPSRLPFAMHWRAPVLGLLPESLTRVDKLYHLQSKPCQAMGYFTIGRMADLRDVAIVSEGQVAAATVALCLALHLVHEGERVLVVEMGADGAGVSALLSRFGPPPDQADGRRETSIPDLDLLQLPTPGGEIPEIPAELKQGYVRILYLLPPGKRPKGVAAIEV